MNLHQLPSISNYFSILLGSLTGKKLFFDPSCFTAPINSKSFMASAFGVFLWEWIELDLLGFECFGFWTSWW
jgi:hypothetical protein